MIDKPLQYWATEEEDEALLGHLNDKIRNYYDDLRETGLLNVLEKSYRAYYGGNISLNSTPEALFQSSKLQPGGKQGEKTRLKVNHFRNFVRHIHQMTTAQKPNVQARASNSDYKSQAQTILGNGLLDYYWREENVANHIKDLVELAIIQGEAFIHGPWNPQAGEVFSTDEMGNPIYEGDQAYELHGPLDVIRDPALRTSSNLPWVIVKAQANRWDLAAKYPAVADKILEAKAVDPEDELNPVFQLRGGSDPENQDLVSLYTCYHNKTESMPQGRLIVFLREVKLFDGPIPYASAPVFRMCGEPIIGTIYGYSVAFDLLGIQEGIDELNTILMSNNKTFGMQSIWTKDTDKITVTQLGGGMKHIKSEEKPEPLQLTASAPESYNYLTSLENAGETISGVSATVRGQPEASLKSGTALALVVSQSIQFISSLEESMNRTIEDVGTGLINNLRDFSKTKRVANIIGESSRPYAKEFEGQDLSEINRVVVEQSSPLSKTIAGRVEIATNLLQQGLLKTPEQYIMVLTTGQLDPALEGTQQSQLNIRAENEELREGRPVQAIVTENHAAHIADHKLVIENPEAKKNPQLIMNTLDHIQQHLDLWRSADPAILMITGQNPPPPPAMMTPQGPMTPPIQDAPSPQDEVQGVPTPNMPGLPPGSPPEAQEAYETLPGAV